MHSERREGKELPTSSTLNSPSVLSQLATPPPRTLQTHMSHAVGTDFAIDDTYDDASTLLHNIVPLGELLDSHIAKAKETETTKNSQGRRRQLGLPLQGRGKGRHFLFSVLS